MQETQVELVSAICCLDFWNVGPISMSKGGNAWTWGNGDENRQTYCSRQISLLKKDKPKLLIAKTEQRGNRCHGSCCFGYTNVGKSTLMNAIGKSDVLSKTFATFGHRSKVVIKPAFPTF
jgi:50S ribosomal subunit-associated GTPase HflX